MQQLISDHTSDLPTVTFAHLAKNVQVGDLIFIRISAGPFIAIADVTGTWTNHVGLVIQVNGDEVYIGESIFPVSRTTTLAQFVARSEHGRIAVSRLSTGLTPLQVSQLQDAARRRTGVLYDMGFNMQHTKLLFCTRYVHEVINEATGVHTGKVQTVREMLTRDSNLRLGFWTLWFFGRIPWERKTMTPVSLLRSTELQTVFFGNVIIERRKKKNALKRLIFKPLRFSFIVVIYFIKKCINALKKNA